MVTLNEIKAHNISSGGHFFDRGNGKVLPTVYNDRFVIALNNDKDGYHVWEYFDDTGRMSMVMNPALEYDFKPMSLDEAKAFVKTL